MLILNENVEVIGLLHAAELLCVAARTTPKCKGKDLLVTALVTGEEKIQLQRQMRAIGQRNNIPFLLRDAENLEQAPVVVLIGTRKEPLRLTA